MGNMGIFVGPTWGQLMICPRGIRWPQVGLPHGLSGGIIRVPYIFPNRFIILWAMMGLPKLYPYWSDVGPI